MKNKYLIIDSEGKLHEPSDFINLESCPKDFKIVIEREALGMPANNKNEKSEISVVAHKLGFQWEQNSSIGFVSYNHNAQLIMELVQRYSRQLVNNLQMPIYEVRGSNFFDLKHPVVQAYAGLFGERLFNYKNGKNSLVMSYDASYPQFNLASSYKIKESNLPFAHFSISDCYRYEQQGECLLLYRQRRFYMPDLHPYCKDVNQAWEVYVRIEQKLLESSKMTNLNYWNVAKVSSIRNWKLYQAQIKQIAIRRKQPVLVEIRRDGIDRYWIVDVDYSFVDSMSQVREIGCIQIDVGNAKRLGIEFSDRNGNINKPVIIHAAVPGGIERYIYALLDSFRERFPFWLYPIQVRLIPVSEKHVDFCEKLISECKNLNLRIEIDDRAESVSKKIKLSHKELIPEIIVIGEKEMLNSESVISRLHELSCRNEGFPFMSNNLPELISKKM